MNGLLRTMLLCLLAVLACDGGDREATREVALIGRVFGADHGKALAGVEISLSDGTLVTTDAEGRFQLRHQARAKTFVRTAHEGFAPVTKGVPKNDSYIELFVKEVDAKADLAGQRGGRVAIKNGAALDLPGKGLLTKEGKAAGPARIELASPDPKKPGALPALPGDFAAQKGGKEGKLSVEAPVYVSARDSGKRELALSRDKRATLELPARTAAGRSEAALFHFDTNEQKWVYVKKVKRSTQKPRTNKATASASEASTYVASIDELGWWSVGEFFDTLTCVRACVVDAQGRAVPFARAIATGIDHFTQLSTYADADGCFALDVRADAQISLLVQAIDGLTVPRVIETGRAGASASEDRGQCQDLGTLKLKRVEADACPLGFRACAEVCADVRSDPSSCGACGNACDGGHGHELSCIDGVCSCALGQRTCTAEGGGGDYCAVVRADDRNCGGCNRACSADQVCLDGECTNDGPMSLPDAGTMDDGGTSGSPALALAPTRQAFGPTLLTQTSPSFEFTFVNNGDGPATGCTAPALSGLHPGEFRIVSDGCGTNNLAAGASCVVTVSAAPTADGERTATLTRACSVGGAVQTLANGLTVNRPHFLFITSTESDGNLGGLSGADMRCETRAAAGSLSASLNLRWRALLSVSGVVDARDRVTWTGPLFDIRNLLATRDPSSWPWAVDGTNPPTGADLLAASEDGDPVGSYVWTGTHEDGTAQSNDCLGWTSNNSSDLAQAGENGLFTSSTAWISSFSNFCNDTFFALICVSDGPAP